MDLLAPVLQAHAADGVGLDHAEADFVSKEVTDVVDAVQDHGGSLQGQAPGDHVDVSRQAHGLQHLRPEHAAVAHLHPLAQLLRVPAVNRGGWEVEVERMTTALVLAKFCNIRHTACWAV